MVVTMKRSECTPGETDIRIDIEKVHLHIEERIRNCSYAFHFNKVSWHYTGGTLTLRGSVASFHLKQILQTLLRDITHVQRLVNEVDVVSATGLSSE